MGKNRGKWVKNREEMGKKPLKWVKMGKTE